MTRRVAVEVDGPTARLLALTRGVQAAEMLPKESAKTLSGIARGLRSLAEAREPGLFAVALDDLAAFAKDAEAETPVLAAALVRHEATLRRSARSVG